MHFLSLLTQAALPKSRNEDRARREFILNVLLLSAIALLAVAIVVNAANILFSDPATHAANSFSGAALGALLLGFVGLYALSRAGHIVLASYLLLGAFFALTAYMGFVWGVDVPAQLVFYPLVIVMAGVLISTRVAFIATLVIAATMVTTGYLENSGAIAINTYWKSIRWTWSDLTMIVLIYLIVATVSWLSNREIEKSLERARRSEAALKEERDLLEVRVEERTNELRQAQMERLSQAYRFVEFGRLAGGIFHDLMNPLAALSLNIDRIAEASPSERSALSQDAARAKQAAAHMQRLMDSMRKHLAREGSEETFSVRQAVEEVVRMLASYAKARAVSITLNPSGAAELYGDPVAFTQIMTNLVSNAVQSYAPMSGGEVIIELTDSPDGVTVRVSDQGVGIGEENLARIFEPFFTTKSETQGLGIGLPLAKRLVGKSFGGTLTVKSRTNEGSTFEVYLPIREP